MCSRHDRLSKKCSEFRRVIWDRFGSIRTHQKRFWKKTFFTIFSIFLKHFQVHFDCFLANFAEKNYKKSIFSKMKPLIKNRLDRIQDMFPYFIPLAWGRIISRFEKAFRFCKHPPKRLFQLFWQALSQKSNFESKIRFSRNVSKCVLDMIDGQKRCSEVRRVVWDRFGPIRTHQKRFWKKNFLPFFRYF